MRLNFAGYKWLPIDGYGRMSLKTTQAMIRSGHDVYPFEIDALDKPAWFLQAQGFDFSHATVQLMPPHMSKAVAGRNFIWSMHESMNLPDGWAEHVNAKAQSLIVPSPWLIEVFENAGVKVPIDVVPGGIDPNECQIMTPNKHRPFTFGCLADRGGRKGDKLVMSAFYRAFDWNNKDVQLLIKGRPGTFPRLDLSHSPDPRMRLWRADVDDVADIYAQMDCYVFPTHCEGYGMPCREAAACGLPTIVTRWSGTADNADEWAIPLNKFTMVESGMEECGGLWAQPDLDELVETMRWVYQHQDDARAIGLRSAQWLRDNQTYSHAANKLVDVLNKYLGAPPPKPHPEPTNAEVMAVNRATLAKLHPNGHRIAEPV